MRRGGVRALARRIQILLRRALGAGAAAELLHGHQALLELDISFQVLKLLRGGIEAGHAAAHAGEEGMAARSKVSARRADSSSFQKQRRTTNTPQKHRKIVNC